MKNFKTFILLSSVFTLFQSMPTYAASKNESCEKLIEAFFNIDAKTEIVENQTQNFPFFKKTQIDEIRTYLRVLKFTAQEESLVFESLMEIEQAVKVTEIKSYLEYSLSFTPGPRKTVLMDINQIGSRDIRSEHVLKFKEIEEKINSRLFKNISERNRYSELYHSCRALTPNPKNMNAAAAYKKLSMGLGLGTLALGYVTYNINQEKNAEWFLRLGYDIGYTIIDSIVGSKIQISYGDSQIAKTVKNYLFGRAMGATDVLIFDPMFSKERDRAENRLLRLKEINEQGNLQIEIDELLKSYKTQSAYRVFKQEVIAELKKTLKETKTFFSLGVSKEVTTFESEVDWNHITIEDLERPEVQDILVLAAMNESYEMHAGDYLKTGDTGIDRYAFNSVFSLFGRIPKNFYQSYLTFNILCMGQDNPNVALTKAALMNVTANFAFNQLFYYMREKAINQR